MVYKIGIMNCRIINAALTPNWHTNATTTSSYYEYKKISNRVTGTHRWKISATQQQ
jgi:hypothetical protein